MTSTNHYQILELSQSASQTEIKQAYRRLAKQFHPDSQTKTANHDQIIRINAAYEILGDPQQRHNYDRQFLPNYPSSQRQQRTATAQYYYQRQRAAEQASAGLIDEWLKNVYQPVDRLVSRIIYQLNEQIDALAADPFDDELMAVFQDYLRSCHSHLQQAKHIFDSQPNPPKLAKVAAALYYCLNQVGDGIDELDWFSCNYDDSHLHTGQELFRIGYQLLNEAQMTVQGMRS
ncbi:DnaJ domain-containing protein [Crocosphaera sp. UHCC 0190]|uniref:J domain-containing protein n=1 Tax=Crocosphaera sp. UHCC 0190 TaxID=3110246 RepID=UPI002B216F8A|nr:DnaJ domain-containing protein [Crocosphaera sp. UHCC 0190]MEA5510838.1 DnaJ domain-containing protein [Crocosphaera sp. UHCC 0190]